MNTSDKRKALKNKLIKKISIKTGITERSVREKMSRKSSKLNIASDAALVLISKEKNVSCGHYQKTLSEEDQICIRDLLNNRQETKKPKHKNSQNRVNRVNKKIIKKIIEYETNNRFIKSHIDEINKAYTYGCYTCVFILARKIVENLIIDILRKKYPENDSRENKELYFDVNQNRFKNFDEILDNMKNKKGDFGTESPAVNKLYDLAKKLKNDANNKVHSLYHIVRSKREIEELKLQDIIDLIEVLERFENK